MDPNLLIVMGALLILVFAYLNFVLQPKLFPYDLSAGRPMSKAATAGAGPGHGVHMFLGILEAAIFMIGVALVTVGCVMIGTTHGYG